MLAHRLPLFAARVASLLFLSACSDPVSEESAAAPVAPPAPVRAATPQGFPTYTETSSEVAEGARLFSWQRCAECHSDAGVILGAGNGNIDVIATAIRDGSNGGMPRYGGKLTDAQIWQLAAFVKALDVNGETKPVRDGFDLTLSP